MKMGKWKASQSFNATADIKPVKAPKIIKRFKQSAEGHIDELIILDTDFNPDDKTGYFGQPYVWEHVKYKNGKLGAAGYPESKDIYQQCSLSEGSCPGCDGRLLNKLGNYGKDAKITRDYNVYLSAIHLNPKNNKGEKETYYSGDRQGQVIKQVKCLVPLQQNRDSNLTAIMDVLTEAYWENNPQTGKPYKSIYGVRIRLKRTAKMVVIGEPIRYPKKDGEQGAGDKWRRISAKKLQELYGSTAVTNDQGNIVIPANNYITQYDYGKIFPYALHEKDICEKYNIPYTPPAGQGDNDVYDGEGIVEDDPDEFEEIEGLDDDIPFDMDDDIDLDTSVDEPEKKAKVKEAVVDTLSDEDIKELEDLDLDLDAA